MVYFFFRDVLGASEGGEGWGGKAGIHPEQPGHTVGREAFERIWRHSVELLQRGFQTGSILTVDPADAKLLGKCVSSCTSYSLAPPDSPLLTKHA